MIKNKRFCGPLPSRAMRGGADLLVLGDGVQQLDIQLRVVLGQGLVVVVADQLHHGAERQRV